MLIVDFSIYPLGQGESVAPYVTRALEIIDRSGLSYELGPMGTAIEGEWDQVMNVLKQCFDDLNRDNDRIVFSVKGDWRRGPKHRLHEKVDAVKQGMKRP